MALIPGTGVLVLQAGSITSIDTVDNHVHGVSSAMV